MLKRKKTSALFFLSFFSIQLSFCTIDGLWKLEEIDNNTNEYTTRSLEPTNSIKFDTNLLVRTNAYYLGTQNTNQESASLSYAYVYTDTSDSVVKVGLTKLASEKAKINGATEETDNPLYNGSVSYLTSKGNFPIVVMNTRNTSYTATPTGTNQTICLVKDLATGGSISVNTEYIHDANEEDANSILGIASSHADIFVAVESNGGGYTNAGISIIQTGTDRLTPVDSTTGNSGNKAQSLAAVGTHATVEAINDMYWDSSLLRLYIALQVYKSGSGSSPESVSSLLVGRMVKTGEEGDGINKIIKYKLEIESTLPLDLTDFDTIDQESVVGFHNAGTPTNRCALHKIKTMHASTNKSYVIVNGNSYTNTSSILKTEVFALPIVHITYSNSEYETSVTEAMIGKIAKKTNQEEVVETAAQMAINTDTAAKVGGGTLPSGQDVQDMFVVGDSVFVCTAGTTDDKKGIFQSSAIFDSDGFIRAWTPWQRVMGSTDKIFGGILDSTTGNYWSLSGTDTLNKDTIKITQWGKGDNDLLGQLLPKLENELPQSYAGIHQIFNFDEKTISFKTDDFSMMIATGYKKVIAIQTGKDSSGVFVPILGNDFNSTNFSTNSRVFTDDALQEIGPICCADVSKNSVANQGWLFVGGYDGWAVLRNSTTGNGWDSSAGLSSLSSLDTLTFKKIGALNNIRKLSANDSYLYILTYDGLYKIALDADNFKDAATTSPTLVTPPQSITGLTTEDSFLDFIISGSIGILATTDGLFKTTLASGVSTEILSSENNSLGPVMHLSFSATTKGNNYSDGNLCALAANISTNLATVIRFDVANNTVTPITESKDSSIAANKDYYVPFGLFGTSFITDGALGLHTLSKHFDRTDYLQMINMSSQQINVRASNTTINLDLESTSYNIGIPIKNTASGAWVIPGDWGIRVNE
jgi:hypothetical protein